MSYEELKQLYVQQRLEIGRLKFALESNTKPRSYNFLDGLFLVFATFSLFSFLANSISMFSAAKEAAKAYNDLEKLSKEEKNKLFEERE